MGYGAKVGYVGYGRKVGCEMRFSGHHLDRLNFNRDRARKVRFFGPSKVEGRLLAPLRFRTKFDARYLYVFTDKSNVRKSGPWSYPKKYPCTFTYIRVLSQDQSMPPKQSNEEIMNMSRKFLTPVTPEGIQRHENLRKDVWMTVPNGAEFVEMCAVLLEY